MKGNTRDKFIEDCEKIMVFCQSTNCSKCGQKDIPFPRCMGVYLAEHLLADGWIRPPCLYIHQFNKEKQKVVVECEILYATATTFKVRLADGRELELPKKFIGYTVFLTREAAEKALEDAEDKNNV